MKDSKLEEFHRIVLKADKGQSTLTEFNIAGKTYSSKNPLLGSVQVKGNHKVTAVLMVEKEWFNKLLEAKTHLEFRDFHILRYNLHSGKKILLMCGRRNMVAEINGYFKGTIDSVLSVATKWEKGIDTDSLWKSIRSHYPKSEYFVVLDLTILKETLHQW